MRVSQEVFLGWSVNCIYATSYIRGNTNRFLSTHSKFVLTLVALQSGRIQFPNDFYSQKTQDIADVVSEDSGNTRFEHASPCSLVEWYRSIQISYPQFPCCTVMLLCCGLIHYLASRAVQIHTATTNLTRSIQWHMIIFLKFTFTLGTVHACSNSPLSM